MTQCLNAPAIRPNEQESGGLDSFRSQYVRRVLALLEKDYERAAEALDLPDDELKALVAYWAG